MHLQQGGSRPPGDNLRTGIRRTQRIATQSDGRDGSSLLLFEVRAAPQRPMIQVPTPLPTHQIPLATTAARY